MRSLRALRCNAFSLVGGAVSLIAIVIYVVVTVFSGGSSDLSVTVASNASDSDSLLVSAAPTADNAGLSANYQAGESSTAPTSDSIIDTTTKASPIAGDSTPLVTDVPTMGSSDPLVTTEAPTEESSNPLAADAPAVTSGEPDTNVLAAAVKQYAEDNVIVLGFTNWGDCQTHFPDNFVHTMVATGRKNYMLVATDNKAYEYLKCRGMNAYNDTASFTGTRLTENVTGYQDDLHTAYHVLALGRFHIVSEVLALGYHVVFSDTDVVIIQDPIPMLLKQPYDVMFLWDGANTADGKTHLLGRGTSGAKGEIQSNAGYFFARNTPSTIAWFTYVRKQMDQEAILRTQGKGRRNDQQIISHSLENRALAQAGAKSLKWKLMPRNVLVNGWLIKNEYKEGAPRTSGCAVTGPRAVKHTSSWMVIHMNYNRGFKRKVVHFKRCGLWECEFCRDKLKNTCMNKVANRTYEERDVAF
mmetsp:Transcript_22801/g.49993  ORF Transcript_22801/g.49993 Transcript_22801/m.49993 type:complete len:470 (-) Transcript_22801:89-1498(-)